MCTNDKYKYLLVQHPTLVKQNQYAGLHHKLPYMFSTHMALSIDKKSKFIYLMILSNMNIRKCIAIKYLSISYFTPSQHPVLRILFDRLTAIIKEMLNLRHKSSYIFI